MDVFVYRHRVTILQHRLSSLVPSLTFQFFNYFSACFINSFRQYFLLISFKPYFCAGGMSERFNEAVLKTVDPKGPGVRIPLPPLESIFFLLQLTKKLVKRNV